MSDGCSTKLNRNYYGVYVGSIVALISVSYFYKFHFLTVAFGYGLGCLICYIGLNSTFLNVLIEKLKKNYAVNLTETPTEDVAPKGCVTCGSRECPRHDNGATQEPWVGLRIHKQLDQAIEEFYNTILDEFVSSWYNKISLQPFFVDEVRFQLRYASACLLRRAVKINYANFITERLIPCALHHYTVWSDIAAAGVPLAGKMAVHPAAANRKAELNYLRSVTNALMPYVLKNNDVDNSVFRVLIREIISGWVLLPLTDVLADPFILNSLIILATGDETMAELPVSPDYHVEFLETFARQSDSVYSRRSKLLKLELDSVLEDQELFYALMQYLKSTAHIYTLQFYKDIKSFQTKLLNPVLCDTELNILKAEAKDIYLTYFDESSPTKINLDPSLVLEMKELLLESDDSVKKLQTSKALYQAARVSHAVLEKVLLPKFLHSEEFYSIFIGSRVPTGYHKLMTKKPQDKLKQAALKLGTRNKSLKYTLDGQVLDTITDEADEENMDILKYLDALASEHTLEHDLTCFKVVLTDVEVVVQAPPRRGPVRVFTLCVHYCPGGGAGGPAARLQRLKRSEHDFHLLHTKLHEFHALHAFNIAQLPSRRDNSPLETLRYKYEDYLQQLLQQNILQTSELLYLFLTTEADFSLAVQASSLSANSTDLINIYQSVAHRLKKEKGQHLESFLKNFLFSSDMERFQAIKHGIEEAQEVSEDPSSLLQPAPATERRNKCTHIESQVFRNNFGVEQQVLIQTDISCQRVVCGPMDCLLYAMLKVLDCPTVLIAVVGHVVRLGRQLADSLLNSYLDKTLKNLLTQRRLAHLIRLGHAVIFDKKPSSIRREDGEMRLSLAREQLQACIPTAVNVLTGAKGVAERVVQLIQQPHVNKQLVYELLDLCLLELFPELNQQDDSDMRRKATS